MKIASIEHKITSKDIQNQQGENRNQEVDTILK
jgi:hypothetical protein